MFSEHRKTSLYQNISPKIAIGARLIIDQDSVATIGETIIGDDDSEVRAEAKGISNILRLIPRHPRNKQSFPETGGGRIVTIRIRRYHHGFGPSHRSKYYVSLRVCPPRCVATTCTQRAERAHKRQSLIAETLLAQFCSCPSVSRAAIGAVITDWAQKKKKLFMEISKKAEIPI